MGSGGSVTIGYKYYLGMHMVVCHGPVDEVQKIIVGDRVAWSGERYNYVFNPLTGKTIYTQTGPHPTTVSEQIVVNAPELFGGEKKEGGVEGKIDIMMGEDAQAKNSYLTSKLGTTIPAFRGVLSFVLRKCYVAAMSPYPKPWAFKVKRIPGKDWYPAKADIGGSANGAHIIYECLTNSDWGMGYSAGALDLVSFTTVADTLYAENFGLSFLLSSEGSIEEFIYSVMTHINGMFYSRPDTGQFAIKLLRDDYDVNTLDEFNETNIVTLQNFERPSFAEMVNEVVVKYRQQGAITDDSVTVQDLAAVQAQEGIISQSFNYPGIDNATNANRVAMRDLRQRSTPLARVKMIVNRKAWNRTIGDVIKFSWAEHGVSGMVLRVLGINFGQLGKGQISLDCIEDVFGLPNTTYMGNQGSGWVDPIQPPAAAAYRKMYEATYWDIQRTLNEANLAYITPTSAFIESAVGEPTTANISYELWTKPLGGSYAFAIDSVFCPHAQITAAITETQTAINIGALNGSMDGFAAGNYAIIDNEWVRVDAYDDITGNMTIGRGCLDSVPAKHTINTRIFFADGFQGFDPTEYVAGETVYEKVLTRTATSLLSLSAAPEDTVVTVGRYGKPYPPGQFKLNTAYYPDVIYDALAVTWAHRDRTLQLATLIDHNVGNIGPEAGCSYTLEFYNEHGILAHTSTGLLTTNYTWSTEVAESGVATVPVAWYNSTSLISDPLMVPQLRLNGTIRTKLSSVVSGRTSFQSNDFTTERGGYGTHYGKRYGA